MEMEIRQPTLEELPAFIRCTGTAFGEPPDAAAIEEALLVLEPERTLAAFDGDRLVASACAFSFELTLPGAARVPVAAVSFVGCLPTHRRRGLLRRLMERQLDDVAARGEPAAILTASEASIYGRFGYGIATQYLSATIDVPGAAFHPGVSIGGAVRMLDKAELATLLPPLYERLTRDRPGEVLRSQGWWDSYLVDTETSRRGASERFYVVHRDHEGIDDGLAVYRCRPDWVGNRPRGKAEVAGVLGLTDEATTTLWRYLLDLDLIVAVDVTEVPLDDPLPWLLADVRSFQVNRLGEQVWVRPLDVETLFSTRTYSGPGNLVFELTDPFRPQCAGRYLIEVDDAGRGSCSRTSGSAGGIDLHLDASALGSLVLGHPGRLTHLARSGRIRPMSAPALARADALLSTPQPPFCGTHF